MKKEAYLKQITLYLKNNDPKAYELSIKFTAEHDKEMISHYIRSKIAFGMGNFREAAEESQLAYNLSENKADISRCAIIAAVSNYSMGDIGKGIKFLEESIKISPSENTKKLLFLLKAKSGKKADLDLSERSIVELIRIINSS